MSFTPEDERGPRDANPIERVVHWCDVVIRLAERNADLYLAGDLTARFALYHAMGLVADSCQSHPGTRHGGYGECQLDRVVQYANVPCTPPSLS